MFVCICEEICDSSELIRDQRIYHPLYENKKEANNSKKLQTTRF